MPITRLFSSTDEATAAVDDLKRSGLGWMGIHVVTSTAGDTSAKALAKAGIPTMRVPYYAERISRGEALVVVDAPLGMAAQATRILQRDPASAPDLPAVTHEGLRRDAATPFSSAFGIPVLSDNPTPFSSFWRIPVLSRKKEPKRSSFGLKLLSSKPAPLSGAVGMPVLSRKAAPLSSAISMKMLSDNPAPLSSLVNMRVLSEKKTYLY